MTVDSSLTPTGSTVAEVTVVESVDKRRARLSTGALAIIMGLVLLVLSLSTRGDARFALSNALDANRLPTIVVPGMPLVLVCGLLTAAAGAVYFLGQRSRGLLGWAGALAGIAVVVGFLGWAASGRTMPFVVPNQLSGTLLLATPLIFGALCGVLCERAGVVNVAIEGQFLTAAFASALVGSATKSITWALIAAIAAAVLMGALLALFSIVYLVDQVVLGVVINLLAAGLTGFLFDQVVKPQPALNNAPLMTAIKIPVLGDIPFFGPILFNQNLLAYVAFGSVAVVWFLLYRTRWGLRVRAVGEHPKAADTVGISVFATRWSAVLVGSVFAGLGGAFFSMVSTGSFSKDMTVGNGFIALAAVIMGRWHPVLSMLVALFFGFVTQMASSLQSLSTPMPSNLLLMFPYLATIVAVAGLVGKTRAPKADGQPYIKS